MSLQPSDPATEAFERLRLEVALLRRAVEGLAAEAQPREPTRTLAALKKAVEDLKGEVVLLGARPALVATVEDLYGFVGKLGLRLMRPALDDLEKDRDALQAALQRLQAIDEAEARSGKAWRTAVTALGVSVVFGAMLWGQLLGPVARALPASWRAPERLAARTLDLPMGEAGEQMLAAAEPGVVQRLALARGLSDTEVAALKVCLESRGAESKDCRLKLRGR